jgi:glycosyltransferase involved in cell wall biosynthesis
MIHLVTLDFPPDFDGGIASWAEDLARALVEAGQEVCVHARGTGLSQAYDRTLPFPVLRMRGRSWGRWKAAWVMAQAYPLIQDGHQALFATWDLATLAAPLLARRKVRFGVAFHGSDLTQLQGTPRGLARVLEGATALLPVSRYLDGLLVGHGRGGRVLPMPLLLGEAGAPGRGLVVVARLNRLKGIDRAIALSRELGWPLTVVGDGPDRARLEALAVDAPVAFTGRLPRHRALEALSGKAACVLLPRPGADGRGAEGLGLSLLEGATRGVPAVGCRTGGVPEVSDLLLDDPDDPQVSARQLRAWLSSGPRGLEAHARVARRHGPQAAAGALLEALA